MHLENRQDRAFNTRGTTLARLAVAVLFLGFAWLTQYLMAAFQTEFWHADDGSHYISGAMIASWIKAGFPHPLNFALDYNAHYPIVGIGLWGPAFYGIEALWMVLFGAGKGAVLALSCVAGALVAFLVMRLAERRCGLIVATGLGVLFLASPLIAPATATLGLDLPIGLFCLLAAMAFARLMEQPGWRWAAAFAALSSFAILTKGNAIALALFVPLQVVMTRRWHLLLNRHVWIAGIAVGVLTLPWYLATFKLSAMGFRHSWGWSFTSEALPRNLELVMNGVGLPVLALAAVGAVAVLRRRDDVWVTACLALLLAVLLFQSIVPASLVSRYMIPALPPLYVIAGHGVSVLAAMATAPRVRRGIFAGALACLVLGTWRLDYDPPRAPHGFVAAAAVARAQFSPTNRSVLVAAFDIGQNALISEIAMLENGAPSLYIIRGSSLLGQGGYNNFEYEPMYKTADEVADAMERYQIPVVVLSTQDLESKWTHIAQVAEVVRDPARGWEKAWPKGPDNQVEVYVNHRLQASTTPTDLIHQLTRPARMP